MAVAALAVTSLLSVAACGSGSSNNNPASPQSNGGGKTPSGQSLKGASYDILGQWTGGEQDAFQAVIDAFDQQTGASGNYTPAPGGDEAGVLGTKVAGGTPPDIAILSLPGAIAQYATSNKLFPVDPDVVSAVNSNFASEWGKLGSYKGEMYCVPVDAANKATVSYNAKLFSNAGMSPPPKTWDELSKDG